MNASDAGTRTTRLFSEFLEARLATRSDEGYVAALFIGSVATWAESSRLADCVLPLRGRRGPRRPAPGSRGVNREHCRRRRGRPCALSSSRGFRQTVSAAFEIIRSRLAASTWRCPRRLSHGRRAVEIDPAFRRSRLETSSRRTSSLGDLSNPPATLAARLANSARTSVLRDVGAATRHVLDVTLEGNYQPRH